METIRTYLAKIEHRHILWITLAALVALVCYTPSLTGPFVFDDQHNIEDNPYIKITRLNLSTLVSAAFSSPISNRPIPNLTFALNYYFNGLNVVGFHVVNIVIHLINGVLVYALIRLTQQTPILKGSDRESRTVALLSSTVWMLHPLHTQSIAYIVQRMTSLSALFYLLSLILYAQYRLHSHRSGRWKFGLSSIVCGFFALASKEIAATLPIFIILYEWYFFQASDWRWFKGRIHIVLGAAILIIALSLAYLDGNPIGQIIERYEDPGSPFSLAQRLYTEGRVVIYYISLIFLPHPSRLNLDYDFPLSMSLWTPWTTLPSLLVTAGLLGFAVWQARRRPLASFAIMWYFGNLLIESSVIGLEIIFEHRTYLPSIFVVYALIYYFSKWIKSKMTAIIALIALSVLFAAWTHGRNQVWSDAVSLWTDATIKSPMKARPHNNLGVAYYLRGNLEDAIDQYRKSIALDPGYAKPYYNLGIALGQKQDFAQALVQLRKAVELEPRNYHAHNNIGVALSLTGSAEEAIGHFKEAIRLKPDYAEAFNNLGISYRRLGEIGKAIASFKQAIALDPGHAEAHNNLGYAHSLQGNKDAAKYHYQRALKIDPHYRTARNNLENLNLEKSTLPEENPADPVQ